MIEIKDDAIFIADSHYNTNRQEFKQFLLKLKNKDIKTSQLFLMGDIFDFLSSQINYFKTKNKDIVNLLNELSNIIDIVYLEGNHDFNLKKVFKNIKSFTIYQQPVECFFDDKKIYLAHGDFESNFGYRAYTWFIRNPLILPILNVLNNTFNILF